MEWDGKERRACLVCVHHDGLEKKLTEMHVAIYGNGDVTKSIYWMTQKNTEFVNIIKRILWPVVIASIIGVISAVANLLLNLYKHAL